MGRPAILKVDIVADAKGVGKGVSDAESRLGRLGGTARKTGLVIGAGLAAAGAAAAAFGVAAVKSASSVEQSFGAVESVFGKAAGQVKGYANAAASSVGLAKSEYASLAAVVGSQLQGMGVAQDASAAKTNDLIKTGADLAATFGGSVSDAVSAVGSLLRGERDPIEKYGVSITAADVAARLAATGQDKLTGAALKSAQAQATLSLLTEKTANASGAFARESNTLAGQQERLAAQFENVKATVGAALLPVITSLFSYIGSTALPAAKRIGAELAERFSPAVARAGGFVRDVLVPNLRMMAGFVTANVLPVVTRLATFFTTRVVPAIAAVAGPALSGLRSAFTSISTAIDRNRENLAKLGEFFLKVQGAALKLAPVVGGTLKVAFEVIGRVMGTVLDIIGRVISAIDKAQRAIGKMAGAARKAADLVGKLNPFGGPPLAGMGVPLVGGSDHYGPAGQLATAAHSLSSGGLFGSGQLRSAAGGVVIVDRRVIDASVHVDGALDAPAVARQIEHLAADQARRLGRLTTYGSPA